MNILSHLKVFISLVILIVLIISGSYYLYNYDKRNRTSVSKIDSVTDKKNRTSVSKINSVTVKTHSKLLEKSFWLSADLNDLNQEIESYGDNLSSLIREDNKRTPLHYAVRYSRNEKFIPILIANGVNPLSFSKSKSVERTALHRSVIKKQDSYKFTKELLKYYPDVDIRDRFIGATPLMWATYNKSSPEVIKLLLEQGADVNAKTSKLFVGSTALMMLAMEDENRRSHLTVSKDQLIESIKILIEYNADFTIKNNEGLTALDYMSKFEKINQTDFFNKLSVQYQSNN